MYFRIFLAYPAGYKLYTEVYPEVVPYTYGKSIGLLQPILGEVEQPYEVVPQVYGEKNTTYPSGFISYAYADFGLTGVAIFSMLVALILHSLNTYCLSQRHIESRVASTVLAGTATNFLCNKSLFSALLSGGILLNIFFLAAIFAATLLQARNADRTKLRNAVFSNNSLQ
jgi:hypothetical protein